MPAASSTRPVTRTSRPCALERHRLGGERLQVRRGSAASRCRRRRGHGAGHLARGEVAAHAGLGASARRRGVVPRRRRCRATRRRGASASSMRRVDDADVGFDHGSRRARSPHRRPARAPRAASDSAAPWAISAWSSGWTRSVMWRALSSSVVERLLGDLRDLLGPRRQLAAHHLARQRGRRLRRARRAISCCSASSWPPTELQQRADLRRRLAREALLEAFERDQAVAVAVLVAATGAPRELLGVSSARSRRCGSAAAGPRPLRRPTSSPSDQDSANELELLARDEARIGRGARLAGRRRRHVAEAAPRRTHRRRRRRARSGLRRPGGGRSSAFPSARPRPRRRAPGRATRGPRAASRPRASTCS